MNPAERPDTSLCGVRLAIDWGKARIGVAASDRDAILAFPVETVHTADRPVQRLAEIVAEYEPVEVIMGLPVALNGTCLLYTSPSPRDVEESRMPSSA